MRLLLAVGVLCVLAGCATDGNLNSWTGREESWLLWKLGPPALDERLAKPVAGAHEPLVVATMREQVPGYDGDLRHLQWASLVNTTDAYLMDSNGIWVVVGALRCSRGP